MPKIAEKRMKKKDQYLKSLPPAGGGWRKKTAERGRNLTGMKRKRSLQGKLTDDTAGVTKLEPALTLIPVLMRAKCF
ncbi:hypothetical protein TNCV_593681 [Trichonephila clavipes]|nr:hypothetical protein TNCV_593681 [Trichonephila clavipes]